MFKVCVKNTDKGQSANKFYERFFSPNIYVLILQMAGIDDVNAVTLVIDGKVGRPLPEEKIDNVVKQLPLADYILSFDFPLLHD